MILRKILMSILWLMLFMPYLYGQHHDLLITGEQKLWLLHQRTLDAIQTSFAKVEDLNKEFSNTLLDLICDNKESFDYSFTQLQDSNVLTVHSSADQKLKIYTWYKLPYTSMVEAYTIYQYKVNGATLVDFTKSKQGLIIPQVSELARIHTIPIGQDTYYFLVKNTKASSEDITQSISCAKITNMGLNQAVPIFKTKTKLLSSISYNFLRSPLSDDRDSDCLIVIDEKNKEIKIPVVNNNLQVTKSYLCYRWKGGYFEYVGIVK